MTDRTCYWNETGGICPHEPHEHCQNEFIKPCENQCTLCKEETIHKRIKPMTDKITIEQAIKILVNTPYLRKPNGDTDLEYKGAIDMAIESLEKQMPKKPNTKFYEQGGVVSKCPICGDWDGDWWFNKPKYCRGCGQKIDWGSDTDG